MAKQNNPKLKFCLLYTSNGFDKYGILIAVFYGKLIADIYGKVVAVYKNMIIDFSKNRRISQKDIFEIDVYKRQVFICSFFYLLGAIKNIYK